MPGNWNVVTWWISTNTTQLWIQEYILENGTPQWNSDAFSAHVSKKSMLVYIKCLLSSFSFADLLLNVVQI